MVMILLLLEELENMSTTSWTLHIDVLKHLKKIIKYGNVPPWSKFLKVYHNHDTSSHFFVFIT